MIRDEQALLEALVVAARAAGAEILKLVEAGFEVETKNDESPVTVCDRAAEFIILEFLRNAAPGVPVNPSGFSFGPRDWPWRRSSSGL